MKKGISRHVVKYYSKIPAIVGVFSCNTFSHYNTSRCLIVMNNKRMSRCHLEGRIDITITNIIQLFDCKRNLANQGLIINFGMHFLE